MPELAPSNGDCTLPAADTADSSSAEEGAKNGLNLERTATFKDYLVRTPVMETSRHLLTISASFQVRKHMRHHHLHGRCFGGCLCWGHHAPNVCSVRYAHQSNLCRLRTLLTQIQVNLSVTSVALSMETSRISAISRMILTGFGMLLASLTSSKQSTYKQQPLRLRPLSRPLVPRFHPQVCLQNKWYSTFSRRQTPLPEASLWPECPRARHPTTGPRRGHHHGHQQHSPARYF